MRLSQYLHHTLREAPAEADTEGHALLLRGGYVRQVGAGLFSYTPLGLRVKRRIERILREEMDALGALEVSLPVVQPAELWRESGRWDEVGDEMARFTDRAGRDVCLAMTHEEAATHLVRGMVRSYRQLPLAIYQLQTKFRDEPRSRGGLLRVREFTMKDAYSFHTSEEDLDAFYQRMHAAYLRVFERCGLEAVAVKSDMGMMGGSGADEFMALLPVGEDTIILCDACGYRANRQVARTRKPELPAGEPSQMEEVATPGAATIEQLADYLGVPAAATAKAVFLTGTFTGGEERLVFAVVRGDTDLNETKLANAVGSTHLRTATEEEIRRVGAEPGYASPVGITREDVIVVIDESVAYAPGLVAGANRVGYHLRGVAHGRDYRADVVTDLAAAEAGDACSQCGAPVRAERGVEVGNIFKLGTRYSQSMDAHFVDEQGERRPFVMGSYGIGPGRVLACIAQVHRDEQGLVWPTQVAPFHVEVVSLAGKAPEVAAVAEGLYASLIANGVDALLDDREERPGVKFADADLIGAPWRVTVGQRALEEGLVEVKRRSGGDVLRVPVDEVAALVRAAPAPAPLAQGV